MTTTAASSKTGGRSFLRWTTFAVTGLFTLLVGASAPAQPDHTAPASVSTTAASPVERALQALREQGHANGWVWGPDLKRAYLEQAQLRALSECAKQQLSLPPDFLEWVDSDPIIQASVYGSRQDPLPVLLGLRSLEIDLGKQTVRHDYPQLALAFAINASHRGWTSKPTGQNDGRHIAKPLTGPDISPRPPLSLVIPGDPRVHVNTKDPARELDRDDHIINFLEDHPRIQVDLITNQLPPLVYDTNGIAKARKKVAATNRVYRAVLAADVLASTNLQHEFNAYMQSHGQEVAIDCGERVVSWYSTKGVRGEQHERIKNAFELFREAYRAKGRLPRERDPAPTPAESMAWLIRNDRHQFSPEEQKTRHWPRFPLTAPWPTLMMLADDDQPLREREAVWVKFRDQGEMKTYGEYIGDIAQQFDMQSARRLSPFSFDYGTIEMMWKDGGVCGTMASIGARTYRICGIPAATAGQPGHCALVLMSHDPKTGKFACKGDQYAGAGDEAAHVHYRWNYTEDDAPRPMIWYQSVAWAVNHGFGSFLDTMIIERLLPFIPEQERATRGLALANQGLDLNPYAFALVDAALGLAPDAAALPGFNEQFQSRLTKAASQPGAPETKLYRLTVEKRCLKDNKQS